MDELCKHNNVQYLFYLSSDKGEMAVEDVCGRFHVLENTPAGTPFHCCVRDKLPEKFNSTIVGSCADIAKAGYEVQLSMYVCVCV